MAQKLKVNPHKIPKTQADVDRAEQHGREFGIEFALTIALYVLKDKHDAPDDEILQFRDEFMYVIESLNEWYLSYADIQRALKSDYDLTVHLVDRGKIR